MRRIINGVVVFFLLCGAVALGQQSPPEVLASLRVGNGSGSATTILKGPTRSYHLTCNHVFGQVDGEVLLETVEGVKVHARCVATDPKSDLSLLRTYSEGIVSEAEVAGEVNLKQASWTSCGFPHGVGPNKTSLIFLGEAQGCGHWRFRVHSGTYQPGVSGGGLYADGKLCGVTSAIESHGEPHTINREQVMAFLAKNRDKFIDPSCPNGLCPKVGKPWLQPNVPIVVPPLPPQPPVVLPEAEGKRDNSVFKDSAATARILELEKRVAALEIAVAKLTGGESKTPPPPLELPPVPTERGAKGEKGEKGDTGLIGPRGEPGRGVDPSELADIKTRLGTMEHLTLPVQILGFDGRVKTSKLLAVKDGKFPPLKLQLPEVSATNVKK